MFSSNNMTQEQKDYFNKNFFNTPEDRAEFYKMTSAERASYISDINKKNILTRDTNLKTEYAKTAFDRNMEEAKRKAEK
jgi:hypothetical protein